MSEQAGMKGHGICNKRKVTLRNAFHSAASAASIKVRGIHLSLVKAISLSPPLLLCHNEKLLAWSFITPKRQQTQYYFYTLQTMKD
jgi:hypothetical protein